MSCSDAHKAAPKADLPDAVIGTGRAPCPGECGLVPECTIVCNEAGPQAAEVASLYLAPGELLHRAGQAAAFVYGIRSGCIRLSEDAGPGHPGRTTAVLYAGDVLGLGVLDDPVWRYDAAAVLPTGLCAIPLARFLARATEDTVVCRHVSRLLARRIHRLRQASARERGAELGTVLEALVQRLRAEIARAGDESRGLPVSPATLALLLNEPESEVQRLLQGSID